MWKLMWVLAIIFPASTYGKAPGGEPLDPTVSPMRGLIERYQLDLGNLQRFYKVRFFTTSLDRIDAYNQQYQEQLESFAFDSLNQAGKVDYLLFKTHLFYEQKDNQRRRQLLDEILELAPWIDAAVELIENRQQVEPIDAGKLAAQLSSLANSIHNQKKQWTDLGPDAFNPIIANRAASRLDEINGHLREWFGFYDGYNPVFSWWVQKPFEQVQSSIRESSEWLKKEVAGFVKGEDAPLLGDPIGRETLLNALAREWVPYSPEQLISIAQKEMAWCLEERKKAAREMGFGDDWRKAQEHVKSLHVGPGEQPQLIKELAKEAEDFLDERDLLTIPDIARETWRMQMMSAERQKVSPYFTGGEVISVSFPTDEMTHSHKLMSMRGNNRHFSKATVHHELIPGHHLQLYMAERYNTHRELFRTPFLVEGWALYWEMLLWDLDFADSPEDRIGMLFWRSHRCARIIFSLRFHLGIWDPEKCIDYLVENVGHEIRNATAEVRRSIQGGYSPLYQAAYMLGGLQLKQLSHHMVHDMGWSMKKFHDAVLYENSIPVELIRASLTGQDLTPDSTSSWQFYPDIKAAAHNSPKQDKETPVKPQQQPRAFRDRIEPNWYHDNSKFWYKVQTGRQSWEFIHVDATTGTRQPAFDHAGIAQALASETETDFDPNNLPINNLEFIHDSSIIKFSTQHGKWQWDTDSNSLTRTSTIKSAGKKVGLRKFDKIRPSGGNGTETEITFENKLNEKVKIYWIAQDGNEVFYHILEPGKSISQRTFASHAWAVKSLNESLVGVFISPNHASLALIDGSKPESLENVAHKKKAAPKPAREKDQPEEQVKGSRSPDGQWVAYVENHNLYAGNLKNGAVMQLSKNATPENSFRQNGQREKFVSMQFNFKGHPEYQPKASWSPNGRYIVAMSTTTVPEHLVHMVQSSPKDQVQPKLHTIPYIKPGDPIPIETPHLFDLETGREIPIDNAMFRNPWRLGEIEWSRDSDEFVFRYNQRGHQVMRMLAVDTSSGKVRAIINEECETFFDYAYKHYWNWMQESGEAIWMSERDGWNHLYLIDVASGTVKNQITSGEFVVRRVHSVDEGERTIEFAAGGFNPDEDPYHLHYFRIGFDGKNLTRLTEGKGQHSISYSPEKKFIIDQYSRVDMPPVHELRNARTGALICQLEKGTLEEFTRSGTPLPQRFAAPGRDGKTMIYGIVHWPDNFDPAHKYPVIENIYAGPHSAHVPKSYRNSYRQRQLTDMGFVVVQIDGMGTSHRSKAFHDVCWKNIVDAGFPDRIAWIKSLAEKYPQLDLSRVGIYGGSAGGQNALAALLTFPDFYKAAVADCGCHDNRMDKIWWNELWMSYPIEDHYHAQSNVTLAPNLQGDLLLLLGEIDKNVDPASTMQVVNALINADKNFDMLVMPNVGHGAAGTRYGWNKLKSFFAQKLLNP